MNTKTEGIEATLNERGGRYGDWTEHARVLDNLVTNMEDSTNWRSLPPFQRQALRTIADKIARMLTGDPSYVDNAHDMVGYARLIEQRLIRAAEDKANGPSLFDNEEPAAERRSPLDDVSWRQLRDEPDLGLATTDDLLRELRARAVVGGYACYRTVDA